MIQSSVPRPQTRFRVLQNNAGLVWNMRFPHKWARPAWLSWITQKKAKSYFIGMWFNYDVIVRCESTIKSDKITGLYMLKKSEEAFLCPVWDSLKVAHFPTAVKCAVANHTFHKICYTSMCREQQNQLIFFLHMFTQGKLVAKSKCVWQPSIKTRKLAWNYTDLEGKRKTNWDLSAAKFSSHKKQLFLQVGSI